jgi:hypothetical protein
MPVVSALGRLRQEDCEFKAILGYITEREREKETKGRKEGREGEREGEKEGRKGKKGQSV